MTLKRARPSPASPRPGAAAAAYRAVTAATFERAQLVVPDLGSPATFHEIVEPVLRLVANLRDGVAHLAPDPLLPRLISGELSVAAAERDLGRRGQKGKPHRSAAVLVARDRNLGKPAERPRLGRAPETGRMIAVRSLHAMPL